MIKINFLKELTSQLSDALPAHLGALKKDFEKNCQAILSKSFAKLDIVTREEFDTQTKVLARTRKKVEDLEKLVKDLENQCKNSHR
ncbi:MAG TPA: accessory factor UbiK family protein [Gammaproteobacteria bacterium]|jgi:BMFP domain-containing protein YqiC|nr:accessory factor UbiK family protein [Gammaproteobacteria bacterium]